MDLPNPANCELCSVVTSRFILVPCMTGIIVLLLGMWASWQDLLNARGLDRLLVLGPACFAASLALFGAEHIVSAQSFMQIVPPWMPARLFWAYFVGFALIAAALSIIFTRFVRL